MFRSNVRTKFGRVIGLWSCVSAVVVPLCKGVSPRSTVISVAHTNTSVGIGPRPKGKRPRPHRPRPSVLRETQGPPKPQVRLSECTLTRKTTTVQNHGLLLDDDGNRRSQPSFSLNLRGSH